MIMFYYQLRNELWKLFGKKRTYIGFGMCLLAESTILLLFRYTHGPRRDMVHRLELMGYSPDSFITNLTMATAVLVPVAFILMPLYVSLVGGDLVAKEAEDGTLRMILSRPISRLRLVATKWVAGAIFSTLLAIVLGGYGLIFASFFFPSGGLFALLPMQNIFSIFGPGHGFPRYAAATLILSAKAITIMGLGWMFSCCNVKPAAATILGLSVILTSRIIQEIPYFHDWQQWFISYHLDFWMKAFEERIPFSELLQSLSVLFGFNVTFFVIGASIFQMRDIKS
jgi:ABC-2 type transport system permease protein